MDVDGIQQKLAKNYRFQVVAFVILGIVYARGAWNTFGVLFLAADAGHTCDYNTETTQSPVLQQQTDRSPNLNFTTNSWNTYKPDDTQVLPRECDVIVSSENGTNTSVPCTFGWVYRNEIESTIVSEVSLP